eukprot:512234_1
MIHHQDATPLHGTNIKQIQKLTAHANIIRLHGTNPQGEKHIDCILNGEKCVAWIMNQTQNHLESIHMTFEMKFSIFFFLTKVDLFIYILTILKTMVIVSLLYLP